MTDWKKEICAERPLEVQTIARGVYMERRGITEVWNEPKDGEPGYTSYECECREIGVDEYNMLRSIEAIRTQQAIDDYTMQLIEEGIL